MIEHEDPNTFQGEDKADLIAGLADAIAAVHHDMHTEPLYSLQRGGGLPEELRKVSAYLQKAMGAASEALAAQLLDNYLEERGR